MFSNPPRFDNLRPLCKSLAPPCIVLRFRIVLRQVKADNAYRFIGHLTVRFLLNKDFAKLTVNAECPVSNCVNNHRELPPLLE